MSNQEYTAEALEADGITVGQSAASYAWIVTKLLLKEKEKELTDEEKVRLYFLCGALMYILVDRFAYVKFNEAERDAFSGFVLLSLHQRIIADTHVKFETAQTLLNKHILALGPFAHELFPEGDQSPQGTLYWEFGKKLTDDFSFDTKTSLTAPLIAGEVGLGLMKEVGALLDE